MKIEGSFVEKHHIEMDVSPWDVFYELRNEAYKQAGIKDSGAYLSKDGTQIMYEEEIRTSHTSYYEEVLIKKPSQVQLDVVRHFKQLQETLGKLDL